MLSVNPDPVGPLSRILGAQTLCERGVSRLVAKEWMRAGVSSGALVHATPLVKQLTSVDGQFGSRVDVSAAALGCICGSARTCPRQR